MRHRLGWCAVVLIVAGVFTLGWTAPPGEVAKPAERGAQIDVLQQQIQTLMQSRETALRAFQTKYETSALADRIALEAEGTQLEEQFERTYLELTIEYHRLTGNTAEQTRAETALEALNRGEIHGVPLVLDRNLTVPEAEAVQPREGGQGNER